MQITRTGQFSTLIRGLFSNMGISFTLGSPLGEPGGVNDREGNRFNAYSREAHWAPRLSRSGKSPGFCIFAFVSFVPLAQSHTTPTDGGLPETEPRCCLAFWAKRGQSRRGRATIIKPA